MFRFLDALTERALTVNPWSNAAGAARSLIALSGLTSLCLTKMEDLIRPASGLPDPLACQDVVSFTLWCQVPPHQLWIAQSFSIGVLVAVLAGWQPRFTAIPFAWVMFSMNAGLTVVDGGDQVAYVLSVLMLPLGLTDPRRWHWTPYTPHALDIYSPYRRITAAVAIWLCQVQVSYIYLNACLTKLSTKEWIDGTSVFYWFTHPMLGAPEYLRPLVEAIALASLGVAFLTWSVLLLEFLLGISMLLERSFRTPLFWGGIAFHLGIAFLFGLWSFAIVMFAALVLLLRPTTSYILLMPPEQQANEVKTAVRSDSRSRNAQSQAGLILEQLPDHREENGNDSTLQSSQPH